MTAAHRIVVVGGGAGGLELATKLGDRLARKGRAQVTLVDRGRTHLWKTLLHEVAAGSMDVHQHQLDLFARRRAGIAYVRPRQPRGTRSIARQVIVRRVSTTMRGDPAGAPHPV
jgi:NADH dehydrogenase